MQADHRRRIGHWLPRLTVPAVLVSLVIPSTTRSQQRRAGTSPRAPRLRATTRSPPFYKGRRLSRP